MAMRMQPWMVAIVWVGSFSACSKTNQAPPIAAAMPASSQPAADHPLPPEPLSKSWLSADIKATFGEIQDVYVQGNNITKFARPQHIYDAAVSPSDRYLYVWHMDYPPRKITVYDLTSRKRISSFAPGAGGRLCWAEYDLLYHEFGAGVNSACWGVYTVEGRQCWRGTATGASLDPSGKFIFVFPTTSLSDEEIIVADIRNGDVYARTRPERDICVSTFRWLDGRTVRAWYDADTSETTKSVDLNLNFDKPQPCPSEHQVD